MHRRMRIVKESNEVRCNGRRVGVAMVDSSVKDCTQTLLWLKEKPSGHRDTHRIVKFRAGVRQESGLHTHRNRKSTVKARNMNAVHDPSMFRKRPVYRLCSADKSHTLCR